MILEDWEGDFLPGQCGCRGIWEARDGNHYGADGRRSAPGSPADVQTVNNTQALRESLHRLFRENLSMEVSVVVDMLHGYKNVVKHFLRQPTGSSVFLYVDLDGASHTKGSWFEKLEPMA